MLYCHKVNTKYVLFSWYLFTCPFAIIIDRLTDLTLLYRCLGAKGKQLPKGIYLSTHELSSLINDTSHSLLHQLDRELNSYRETIQSNKQLVVSVKEGEQENIDKFRPQEVS